MKTSSKGLTGENVAVNKYEALDSSLRPFFTCTTVLQKPLDLNPVQLPLGWGQALAELPAEDILALLFPPVPTSTTAVEESLQRLFQETIQANPRTGDCIGAEGTEMLV